MSAIESSSVKVSTLADGTLRLVVDIEPCHAQAAFAMFGAPGTAVALAALKPMHQVRAEQEKAKGGPLSQWLAIRCNEGHFQQWLGVRCTDDAATHVRDICEVESRAEIDSNPVAEQRFQKLIRGPYAKHCVVTGVTA